jgi:hypothetical protein
MNDTIRRDNGPGNSLFKVLTQSKNELVKGVLRQILEYASVKGYALLHGN